MPLLVTNIILTESPKSEIAKRLGCTTDDIVSVELLKKSVDGRRRPPVWLANFLVVLSIAEQLFLNKKIHGVRLFSERDEQKRMWGSFDWEKKEELSEELQPIVVGAGPA